VGSEGLQSNQGQSPGHSGQRLFYLRGTGLFGGITGDALGDGFTATLSAQTTTALWNASQLQGENITTITPLNGQVMSYNGLAWTPASMNALFTAGDGIDILGNTISADVTDLIGNGLAEDASNNIIVKYDTLTNTAVQGNQTATIIAGNGLYGGIANDALGNGFSATLSVDYGTIANTAVEGSQTATITVGGGLTGGITSNALGDGFLANINVRYDSALWNASLLQGIGITTAAPNTNQVLTYNGIVWDTSSVGRLLISGDGVDITNNTIKVDVTDFISNGLSEDGSNNIIVNYGITQNSAVEGHQTATITAGTGLSGGITSDSLGDGFNTTIIAQTDSALWNASKLQGVGITTVSPSNAEVLSYNGSSWTPASVGGLFISGDGIDITGNTIDIDVTDIIGTGLTETANNLSVTYGTAVGTAVQGNQTATIIAGNGLSGGITADALGNGFSAGLNVIYGNSANTAVEGNKTATITAGNGLTGGGETADVTLDVGQGTGITVSPDAVALNITFTDGLYVNENQANSINSSMISDGEVKTEDIAVNAVGSSEVIDNSLSSSDLAVNVISSLDGVGESLCLITSFAPMVGQALVGLRLKIFDGLGNLASDKASSERYRPCARLAASADSFAARCARRPLSAISAR